MHAHALVLATIGIVDREADEQQGEALMHRYRAGPPQNPIDSQPGWLYKCNAVLGPQGDSAR
jgi:hypothetical protein